MSIRIGLIGLGHWGARLLAAIESHPDFDLTGVCDVSDRALLRAPSRLFKCREFELLLRQDLDAYAIAVDPSEQGALALKALHTGAALFVEKPLATSVDLATSMRGVRAPGQAVLVNHLPRYMKVHEMAVALARSGNLGRLETLLTVRHGARHRPHVDALWTLGPHDIALAHAALGELSVVGATRDQDQRVIADAVSSSGARARFWIGAAGPPERALVYLLSHGTIWVDEGGMRILSGPRWTGTLGPRSQGSLRHALHEIRGICAACEPVSDPNPVQTALSDFARAVFDKGPVRSGLDEGVRVVDCLARIESSL